MTEFVSEIKQIPQNDERIYAMLSDLSNLERIKDRIPQDKIKDFEFDSDSCSFSVSPVGKITFQIVDREPCKTIKFQTTNSPVPLFLWIQLKQVLKANGFKTVARCIGQDFYGAGLIALLINLILNSGKQRVWTSKFGSLLLSLLYI